MPRTCCLIPHVHTHTHARTDTHTHTPALKLVKALAAAFVCGLLLRLFSTFWCGLRLALPQEIMLCLSAGASYCLTLPHKRGRELEDCVTVSVKLMKVLWFFEASSTGWRRRVLALSANIFHKQRRQQQQQQRKAAAFIIRKALTTFPPLII